MIHFLKTIACIYNCTKFYSGIALKAANRRKYLRARMLLNHCRQNRVQMDKRHLNKLNNMLTYANEFVPYYHEIFKSIGLVKNKKTIIKLNNIKDLNKIPLLDKKIIRKVGKSLHSCSHQHRGSYQNSSGGSTGEKATFLQDVFYNENSSATFRFARHLMGIPLHVSECILLWAAVQDIDTPLIPKNILSAIFQNTIILNSCKMTEQDMRAILKIMNLKRPAFIRGYSQSLYELANFARLHSIQVRPQDAIISTATTLSGEMRDLVETVFGCKVSDYYGSREVGAIAGECIAHDGLHIFEDNNVLEVVDDLGNNVKEGEAGEVIITTLNNYSMPLIRYRIGDRAILDKTIARCACGCNYKKLKCIIGRTADMFTLRNGDKIDGTYLTTLLNNIESIERFQIIQHNYDLIELIVQAKARLTQHETNLVDTQLKQSMGQECIVRWRYTSMIEPGPTGKYRYVMSYIP